ncbi:proliferation-associated 2G4-like [Micractinium conductrix]|uniref:Proliferation-associated 2G4-like n=1 Tax=Micractinium conductrix TaxID=554055 RepID=A0A2P6UYY0_9CHLO|nr:proliferation-associated 2G4-like [Micractinium conductrix]|eukprot:PSC67049.1 proliferation-associated 2G4-like [Micractinium conductrix]
MSEYGSDHELQEETLSNPDVVTKYKAASKIVNGAWARSSRARNEKGIAVPTCISVNNCVGHYSPLHDNTAELKEGDLVKIDLGCHIDGYIAQAAHSLVVASDPAAPVTGRAADAIACAQTCFDAAARLIRPGKKSGEVAPVLGKIAEAYGCNLVDGVMTYEMTRFVIDAQKAVDECEFEEGEVYAIDIIVTTGEGKPKVLDEKETTVYKRAMEVQYQLKMKASRELLSEVGKKYPTMLFSLRGVEAKQARFGLVECLNHGLLAAYPVTYEKDGDVVAHIKGTVLLMPSGSDRITSAPLQPLQSDKSVEDEEIKALLATSLKNKKKKKKADKEAAPAQA